MINIRQHNGYTKANVPKNKSSSNNCSYTKNYRKLISHKFWIQISFCEEEKASCDQYKHTLFSLGFKGRLRHVRQHPVQPLAHAIQHCHEAGKLALLENQPYKCSYFLEVTLAIHYPVLPTLCFVHKYQDLWLVLASLIHTKKTTEMCSLQHIFVNMC